MVGFDYAYHHVSRAFDVARGNPVALSDMDISADGFWRSFAAIIYAFPALFFSWAIDMRMPDPTIAASPQMILAIDIFIEAIAWFLPILLLAGILRALGLSRHFARLVIVRNWFSVITAYIAAVALLPEFLGLAGPVFTGFVILGMLLVFMVLLVNITRLSLESGAGLAVILVAGEVALIGTIAVTAFSPFTING